MALSLRSFSDLVSGQAAVVQAAASQTLEFGLGTVQRAILEATASLGLWMQYVAVQVLRRTRLATSSGADADTFVQDFALTRLPPASASGFVVMSRYTTGVQSTIPVGTTVLTSDRTLTFAVTADSTNSNWNGTSGYTLPAFSASISVPVQCTTAGSAGNVSAGAISLMGTSVAGVDVVANGLGYANGIDTETDAALKSRFASYIQSLARCTVAAIEFACTSVQQGLTVQVLENTLPLGQPQMGFFTVVVDDGSGAPPTSLLNSINAAVDLYRPIGTSFSVIPPIVAGVAISLTITVSPSAAPVKQSISVQVANAVTAYIDGLSIGDGVNYGRLFQIAFGANPAVRTVSSVVINNVPGDFAGASTSVVKLASLAVN